MNKHLSVMAILIFIMSLALSACGQLTDDGRLFFKTADPKLTIGVRLLQPPAPPIEPQVLPTITPTPCEPVIKGNISRDNRKLYHLPGMPNYNQVVPEEVFCTEADAQAAGFEKAGN